MHVVYVSIRAQAGDYRVKADDCATPRRRRVHYVDDDDDDAGGDGVVYGYVCDGRCIARLYGS